MSRPPFVLFVAPGPGKGKLLVAAVVNAHFGDKPDEPPDLDLEVLGEERKAFRFPKSVKYSKDPKQGYWMELDAELTS